MLKFLKEIFTFPQVMAGYPFEGRGRGVHVLRLMKSLSPILHPDLVDIWDTVIPKLTQYLEDNTDDKDKWNQKSWEDLVLKLLSKSLDEVDADEWVCAVGQEMGNQIQLYTNCPKEKVNSGLSEVSRDRKLEIRFICVPTVQRKR